MATRPRLASRPMSAGDGRPVLMVLTVVGGEHSERNVRSKERAEREQAELDARAEAAAGYRR